MGGGDDSSGGGVLRFLVRDQGIEEVGESIEEEYSQESGMERRLTITQSGSV